MFTSETINILGFFYPIGNTPAVSLTQSLPSQDPADILLLGCGDLRNVLFTAHVDGRPLDITSCDVQKAVIARNILLLTLMIDDVDATHDAEIWSICYHMRLNKASDDVLQDQAKKLVLLSATMEDWQQSKYGSQLKFCDTATLTDVRNMWSFYSSSSRDNIQKQLNTAIDKANNMQNAQKTGFVITGSRSAAPAHIESLMDMNKLRQHFWKEGTTDLSAKAIKKAKLPNPMFLTVDDTSSLHYGTDPMLGFHLASAYAPLQPRSPLHIAEPESTKLQRLVDTARLEFKQWIASFRKRAGAITLRFLVGDAISFSNTLQHARQSGSPTAGYYRERYQLQPLVLLETDYSIGGSAPVTFDVVDTSNLCDHVGPLNLLTAVSPLLRSHLASTLYTEVIPKRAKSRQEILDTMLCGDAPTVSTLLALFPVEYWTGASCVSHADESLPDFTGATLSGEMETEQMYLRIAWKRPPNFAASGKGSDLSLLPIRFHEQDLATLLYQIYVRMFEDEDTERMLADIRLGPAGKVDLNSQPQYHRAGLAAFLRLVKSRVTCDWHKMMQMFVCLTGERPHSLMSDMYYQELFVYLHLLDVHTVGVFKCTEAFGTMSSAPPTSQHLRAWTNIPPVVCVTVKVPRKNIKIFTDVDPTSVGTPTAHCVVGDEKMNWANLFSACQFSFGEISCTGVKHSDSFEVCVTEDKDGWHGSSALVVTFLTPSWAILRDYSSATVAFSLHQTPLMIRRFMKDLGSRLTIYETTINSAENVYITKYAPHLHSFPKVPGFTLDQITAQVHNGGSACQSVTAGVSAQTGRLLTMTGRLDIESEKLQAIMKSGAIVTVRTLSPCHLTVTLGQEKSLDLFFPVPVVTSNHKILIGRKSAYVEVIAKVATAAHTAEFPTSFVHPLCLTGQKKVPLAWSISHLDLQKQPALDIRQVNKLGWLNPHFSAQMSNRERAMRDNEDLPRSPGEAVRFEFKEGLFSLLVQFAGLQGPKQNLFGICNPGNGGVHLLIFPNKLRIDLATRTVVLDCAVLPLHKVIMPKLEPFFKSLLNLGLVQIKVDDAELSMWKQVLPAWVERCRIDWTHKESCEYRTTGKIPLTDQHDDTQFLCSCGQDVFPGDFELPEVPRWEAMARKYATRAAISPLFWAPFADEVYRPPMGDLMGALGRVQPPGTCNGCGVKQAKDEKKKLMKCGKCLKAEYCSVECQKKDWKLHKTRCSAMKA